MISISISSAVILVAIIAIVGYLYFKHRKVQKNKKSIKNEYANKRREIETDPELDPEERAEKLSKNGKEEHQALIGARKSSS